MRERPTISISNDNLRRGAELARRCSSVAARERALVSQAVALAIRDYLGRDFQVLTQDGRSASSKYVELLDVCDFKAVNWLVEVRAMTNVERLALYVPTMPLMVGILSDFYVCAQVDEKLTRAELQGFANRADLATADLSENSLFAILPVEELRPLEELRGTLSEDKPSNSELERLFGEWQSRAERVFRAVSELLTKEAAFGPEQIESLAAGLRDDIFRIYGEALPETGLEPLFERLFRRFGIDAPVPATPAGPVAFQNRVEDRTKFASPDNRARFFSEELNVKDRVALYRYLLDEDTALEEHRRVRRAYDRATDGKHQTSQRRRERVKDINERRAASSFDEPPRRSAVRPTEQDDQPPSSQQKNDMDIFDFRRRLIGDYADYVKSFIKIRDEGIKRYVEEKLDEGALWPEPLIQLNPSFKPGETIDELVVQGELHPECGRIFRKDKDQRDGVGRALRLHKHQSEAVRIARRGENYVLTTGTGSGKSLSYIIPIVDHVLRNGSGRGVQAIVVYPMNALANSQYGELEKFLCHGYPDGRSPVTFRKYTGQEGNEEREQILNDPPDILLTNFVMLELILTRPEERRLVEAARGLRFLVLDELHTYRGRQGADVALLVRRLRDRMDARDLQCVGTSATVAGGGTLEEQQSEVAQVASLLFGDEVKPECIITETLERVTPARDQAEPEFIRELTQRITGENHAQPRDFDDFINDPLAIWIESAIGVRRDAAGRLIRNKPRSIYGDEGVSLELSRLTGVSVERCATAIQECLLAGYQCEPRPEKTSQPFAFRLHQFISRGDTVYGSLEDEATRHLTIYGQQFKPGSRDHILLPMVFCRECGQEYFCVRRVPDSRLNLVSFVPRELRDQQEENDSRAGFLYFSSKNPWPDDPGAQAARLPDEFVEEKNEVLRPRRDRKDALPQLVRVDTKGYENGEGAEFQFIPAPFRFCLNCRVSYNARQRDDFAKLSPLGSEGRSTATTILSLSTIRNLRNSSLSQKAQKLLSFTDNRQDASLQAGHFNDFVEIALLRSALYKAVRQAGEDGISHDELTARVFEAIDLPPEFYAANPDVRFQALKDTQRALREVIGYRLYRDLQRGWRITAPNLEQCGLLEIVYESLDEACGAEDLWVGCHQALVEAGAESRGKIAKTLLDYMRREMAINVPFLDSAYQERIKQQSYQFLIAPWAIDENERLEFASILFPRPRRPQDKDENVFLSARGGFGQYLRREFKGQNLRLDDIAGIISDLLEALAKAGIVAEVIEAEDEDVPGYQLQASAIRWKAGDGTRAFHDPIRTPNAPEEGSKPNPFFVEFYRSAGADLHGLEAHEHTAQVEYDKRLERERDFREGRLPIMYCSPTMELGVDIAELNIVNLRNIPPTPANYAQRSGRAGRSGQPALVFSYCTTGSPHDQYFFKRPDLMVSGQVAPPRFDLANQDLLRAHIHAIWLAEVGFSLGRSIKDLLDTSGAPPTLELLDSIRERIESTGPKLRARVRAGNVLSSVSGELLGANWYSEGWLDETLNQASRRFDQALRRWRDLYLAALNQAQTQDGIIRSALRSPQDKKQAERLRAEAESQLRLLTEVENVAQSDFYSYRYFASEGFLPGYNFPRLPISAYIPGRRQKQRDEFLSRPRFLAIAEFGPRSIVYHEGSRYVVNKVIMPVGEREAGGAPTNRAKLCQACGYLHPFSQGEGPDICERCGVMLDSTMNTLFKMQNVSARRRDKISSDEEERVRQGFEIVTAVWFTEHGGQRAFTTATVESDGEALLRLTYGPAATIWRINKGWRRRKEQNLLGFVLDVERGYWARNEQAADEPEEDNLSPRTTRVVPYVEDSRNCLLIEPAARLDVATMASLQAAVKNAIQVCYQLEDNELAAEPLPNSSDRRLFLLYEAAEGGAGVLRRLCEEQAAIAEIAREALRLCHYDPDNGDDLRRAPRAKEDCEAACYDCLMSYYNQREHQQLDRKLLRDLLMKLAQSRTATSPGANPRADHLAKMLPQCESELERRWLNFLESRGFRLPSKAQTFIESCLTRPDFIYEDQQAAIYVDGPSHEFPDRQARDHRQTEAMEDRGFTVIRFGHADDWDQIVARYPYIFGATGGETRHAAAAAQSSLANKSAANFDLDLFDAKWRELLSALSETIAGAIIEPGGDASHSGRVVGPYFAQITAGGFTLRLIDAAEENAERIKEALLNEGFEAFVVEHQKWREGAQIIARTMGER